MGARRAVTHPAVIAALLASLYGLWLATAFLAGRDARDFTIINQTIIGSCHASSVIHVDPNYHYPPPTIAYDGAFYYLIALDPLHAACYLDNPSYRYMRILYPLAARLLALDQVDWIPATLILVNLLSLAGGALVLAAWLRRNGISPWFSLLFGLYPGLFVSLWRDLTEPLSYALVALAVYLFDFGGRRHILWAGCCFGLAALARETAVIFAIVYGLSLLTTRRWSDGVKLLALALLPIALYKILLRVWLGASGLPVPAVAPLSGLTHYWPWQGEQIDLALVVVLPGLICAGMAIWALLRRLWSPEVVNVLANFLVLVILLPAATYVEYYAAGRATAGVMLAAILCLPFFDRLTSGSRAWLWVVATLWLLPWYSLVPLALTWADPKL